MIPDNGRHAASFRYGSKDSGGYSWMSKPIVAWDDEGYALIAGEESSKAGRLVRACTFSNFHGITDADPVYVAAVPGGGWQVAWPQDDGTEYVEPVVAWALKDDGSMQACTVDVDGYVDTVPTGKVKLIRPDGQRHGGDDDGVSATVTPLPQES